MKQLKITQQITQRNSLALDKYLNDVGKIAMIDTDEEVRLARLVKEGDEAALNKLTRANLRFVISVAKQYQHQGLALSDLINEGNLGLIKAAHRFDETKGFKFISYAVWWIRQSILQAIVENARMVRLPLNKVGSHYKLTQAVQQFMQDHEREPSEEELADILEMRVKDVKNLKRMSVRHLSFDAPVGAADSEESFTMLDTLACHKEQIPENNLMEQSVKTDLYDQLGRLSKREQQVVKSYFGLNGRQPMTLEDIGYECNLTRERVRQIKERALSRLRKSSNQMALRAYLG